MTDTIQPATPGQVAWLRSQLPLWQAAGLVGETEGAAILGRYREVRRLDLSRLALWLGAGFLGIGLLWLVAANLDRLPPLGRFAAVVLFWLATVAAAEVLDRQVRTRRSPVVGAARGLAALAYGAVVMQAAQSLQVPAYDARLVGVWGAGALLYAYAVRGTAPLVVGVAATAGWLTWHVGETAGEPFSMVLALVVLGTAGLALARWHRDDDDRFATVWRLLGTVASLVALFVAAIPWQDPGVEVTATLLVALGIAGALAAAAFLRGPGELRDRAEAVAGLAVAGPAVALAVWSPDTATIDAEAWLHAIVSVVVFVAVAAGVVALGVLRDEPALTWLAVIGMVLFTTVQSFAVFAEVITGAWLFVVIGLVFGGTGWVADRARREMVDALEGADR